MKHSLSAYQLACGYIETRDARLGGRVTLWREHGVYHVREWDAETGRRVWLSFHTLSEARKAFIRARS